MAGRVFGVWTFGNASAGVVVRLAGGGVAGSPLGVVPGCRSADHVVSGSDTIAAAGERQGVRFVSTC